MHEKSNRNAHYAPQSSYLDRPRYAYARGKELPPPPQQQQQHQPYPQYSHPSAYPYPPPAPTLASPMSSPYQHHMVDTGRPSSASSSSSCAALTPTSSQLHSQFHLPAVSDPVIFVVAPPGAMSASDEFLPQPDWRYAASADAPLTHIWGLEDPSSCLSKTQPFSPTQFVDSPYADRAYSDGSDMCSDEYDHESVNAMHSLYPWQLDSSSTDHTDDRFLQHYPDAYHQHTVRPHTPQHITSSYFETWNSPPEPTSSSPVSLSASSPSCIPYQPSSPAPPAETNSPPSLCLHQPQPIRPIPIIPLSALSESSIVSPKTPSLPRNTIVPNSRRPSRDYPLLHKLRRRIRSRPRSSRAQTGKPDLLSPLSLLCQPVSDSIRYQLESIDAINVDEPGAHMMDDSRNSPSPQRCHGTLGQMGGFFCACGCFGSKHSVSLISDIRSG